MKSILYYTSCLLPVLSTVHGAPAGKTIRDSANPPLRGSEDLLGYSQDNKLTEHSTEEIKYTLLPAQKEDPKIGSYLDFEKAANPQPIRGDLGATDPGPREFISFHG
jgi:hypothetical protein